MNHAHMTDCTRMLKEVGGLGEAAVSCTTDGKQCKRVKGKSVTDRATTVQPYPEMYSLNQRMCTLYITGKRERERERERE